SARRCRARCTRCSSTTSATNGSVSAPPSQSGTSRNTWTSSRKWKGARPMCGIAGIIYRGKTGDVGRDMTRMLQSMRHRGPDSTGFALYGEPTDLLVMRFKLADPTDERDFEFTERLERNRREVE